MTDDSNLADRMACVDLIARYASGADWLDEAMFGGVFWDDAQIDFGNIQSGKAAFVAMIMDYRAQFSRRWHHFALPRVALSGDAGIVESTCIAHLRPIGAVPPTDNRFFGRYLMTVERRGTVWRIIRLTYMMTFCETSPIDDAGEPPLRKADDLGPHHPLFALR